MNGQCDINKLLRLEAHLNGTSCGVESSRQRDAKVNLLKFLQVGAVKTFERSYDDRVYELDKTGGLDCLRNVVPVPPDGALAQKNDLDLQGFLAEAGRAKSRLDDVVKGIVEECDGGCRHQEGDVKSRESSQRKAGKCYNGDVRRLTDMARVSVICDKPEDLERAYMRIINNCEVRRVKNSFIADWSPGGYRDVKVSVMVDEHICEIQLHLSDFFSLKAGQHTVYKWARDLDVTAEIQPGHLFATLSGEVLLEMVNLASGDWNGTGHALPHLYLTAGLYRDAEAIFRKELSEVEAVAQLARDHVNDSSLKWHWVVLAECFKRNDLITVFLKQGKTSEAEQWFKTTLDYVKSNLGSEHPVTATVLNNHAQLLKSQERYDEAAPLYEESHAIRVKVLGRWHPDVAESLTNWASLLSQQEHHDRAERLAADSYAIWKNALGPAHSDVGLSLCNWAVILKRKRDFSGAQRKNEMAQQIFENTLGRGHPRVAIVINNRASLLCAQDKHADALRLLEEAMAIRRQALDPRHPDLARTQRDIDYVQNIVNQPRGKSC
ncbi:unnamed protein product [Ectocarpus fasciculatus]